VTHDSGVRSLATSRLVRDAQMRAPKTRNGLMFANRIDAGRRLAERLDAFGVLSPIVVGMARGGVPVAAVIADRLGAALDVVVVRKIGVPWQPELGAGAISEDGVRVYNERLIREVGLRAADLEPVIERERRVLDERVRRYRRGREPISLQGKVAILVDDGLATGFTARAAIETLRRRGASRVVLAVPVAPPDTVAELAKVADDVIALETPEYFMAIGEAYRDFSQTSDDEIERLLGPKRAPVPQH
jgi:putative phosphoribosyl transferase